jgi:hypothetical protein
MEREKEKESESITYTERRTTFWKPWDNSENGMY